MTSDLLKHAQAARVHAYAPYSGYKVGVALLSKTGKVYTGCNVENVSYGLTMCAERSAVFAMVNGGDNEVSEIWIVTADGGSPCGACRQVLAEFTRDPTALAIHCVDESGGVKTYSLSGLLPHTFASDDVKRTEP